MLTAQVISNNLLIFHILIGAFSRHVAGLDVDSMKTLALQNKKKRLKWKYSIYFFGDLPYFPPSWLKKCLLTFKLAGSARYGGRGCGTRWSSEGGGICSFPNQMAPQIPCQASTQNRFTYSNFPWCYCNNLIKLLKYYSTSLEGARSNFVSSCESKDF